MLPAHSFTWEQVATKYNRRASIYRSADGVLKK